MGGLSYKGTGVDIDAGEELIGRIKPLAARTRIPEQLGSLGGFAGLCALPSGMKEPVLVSGTDGVGTKLKVAFAAQRHDTIGIDLVAMCVNDIVTTGARPLFFLDYFGTGRLSVDTGAEVVEGIARGCELAGCGLLGGETAELPGMYQAGEYDLAGFAVGVVERSAILDGSAVKGDETLIGIASDGLHSNGYSLARGALLERAGLRLDSEPDGLGEPLVDALLRPTRIYARAAQAAVATGHVRAMSHITGGGLPGNLPRILPAGVVARLDPSQWHRPAIFDLVQKHGEVKDSEMYRTFNMGLGMVLVVDPAGEAQVLDALEASGERAQRIGTLQANPDDPEPARVDLA